MSNNKFNPQGNSRVDRDVRRYKMEVQRVERLKLLLKVVACIGAGLFCWGAMVTNQMADWIAIPAIFVILTYGACQIDRWFEMGGAV